MVNDLLTTDLRRVSNGASIVDAFQVYTAKGYITIPLNGKDPSINGKEWQLKRYSDIDFDNRNIGLLLGEVSGNLTDIDLDCPEARALAPLFLPPTSMRHGRPGAQGGHWWYRTNVPVKAYKYQETILGNKKTLIELRSSLDDGAAQTMVPPSIHPSGEKLIWEDYGEPALVNADTLVKIVRIIAAAALLARHFPKLGGRHDFALALSGALLRHGWDEKEAENFIFGVCATGGSDNPEKHMQCVKSTAARLASNQTTVGIPALKEFVDNTVIEKIIKWLELDRPALRLVPTRDGEDKPPEKKVIRVDVERWLVVNEMIEALSNHSAIYQKDRKLIEVLHAGTIERNTDSQALWRPASTPQIYPIVPDRIGVIISEVVEMQKLDLSTKEKRETRDEVITTHSPPLWLPGAILTRRAEWPGIRELRAIGDAPAILPDGRIVSKRGYDEASALYLANDFNLVVPERPTRDQAIKSTMILLDLVCEFPFVDDDHMVGWLAALLTMLAKFAFDGNAPFMLFEAAAAASGKTLAVDLIAQIVFGQSIARTPWSDDDAEIRKKITTAVADGDRMVLFDNVANGSIIKSASLDSVLTGNIWKDRKLGVNESICGPSEAVWFASGNNLSVGGDLERRVLYVRMESKLDDPGARSDFRYDLNTYPKEHRMELLSHGLTILRAFIQAGCPSQSIAGKPLVPMASFEEWSKIVRGAVVWCTGHDPLATRTQLQQIADRSRTAASILVKELHKSFPGEFTARVVVERLYINLHSHMELREALEELCEVKTGQRASPVQVGTQFRKLRGRVFDGLWLELVQEGDQHKSGKWLIGFKKSVMG